MVRRTPDAGARFIEGAFNRAGKNWAWPPYIVLDPGDGLESCEIELQSPAPDVGLWVIRCRRCEGFAAITVKGSASDAKRVWLACKTVPRRAIDEEANMTLMLQQMAESIDEALARVPRSVNPFAEAHRRDAKMLTELHSRRLRLALDLDARHEPTILKAFLDFIADMIPRFRRGDG